MGRNGRAVELIGDSKRCTSCKVLRPLSEFYKGTGAGGKAPLCIECKKNRDNNWNYHPANEGSKTCTQCHVVKHVSAFHNNKRHKDGKSGICKTCDSENSKNHALCHPETVRNNSLKRKFGIDLSEYNNLYDLQGGLCAVCHRTCPSGRTLAVDHNHITGEVRELLCGKCNAAIGLLDENIDIIDAVRTYLEKHSGKHSAESRTSREGNNQGHEAEQSESGMEAQ